MKEQGILVLHWTRAARTVLICSALLILAGLPATAQTPVFDDGFENGGSTEWTEAVPMGLQLCICYFSSDCTSGNFCNWGPGGPSTEDICEWTNPKPSGVPGSGCDSIHQGPWGGSICDGYCEPSSAGSPFGSEDRDLVIQGVELWSRAILKPSVHAGGGPVDPALAQQALALPFSFEGASLLLGRHVADLLILTSSSRFYDHFCHYEQGMPNDPSLYVDLSNDPCARTIGELGAEALAAELTLRGTGAAILERIPQHCIGENFTLPRCAGGDTMACLQTRISDLAHLLATPRGAADVRRLFQP